MSQTTKQQLIRSLGENSEAQLSEIHTKIAEAFRFHILDPGLATHQTPSQIQVGVVALLSAAEERLGGDQDED